MKTTVVSVADDMHIKCGLHADSSLFSHGSVCLARVAGCESPAQPPSVPDASRAPPESIRLILAELYNQTSSSESAFTLEPVPHLRTAATSVLQTLNALQLVGTQFGLNRVSELLLMTLMCLL